MISLCVLAIPNGVDHAAAVTANWDQINCATWSGSYPYVSIDLGEVRYVTDVVITGSNSADPDICK